LIWIQLLGGAGFLILAAAPLLRSKRGFLFADIAGVVPVTAHYMLMGAKAGAAMSAMYFVMDVMALMRDRGPWARRAYLLVYLAALGVLWLVWEGPVDLLAGAGALLAVAARQQTSTVRLKLLVFASALAWGAYGVIAGSIPQMLFSAFYAASGLYGAWRDHGEIGKTRHD